MAYVLTPRQESARPVATVGLAVRAAAMASYAAVPLASATGETLRSVAVELQRRGHLVHERAKRDPDAHLTPFTLSVAVAPNGEKKGRVVLGITDFCARRPPSNVVACSCSRVHAASRLPPMSLPQAPACRRRRPRLRARRPASPPRRPARLAQRSGQCPRRPRRSAAAVRCRLALGALRVRSGPLARAFLGRVGRFVGRRFGHAAAPRHAGACVSLRPTLDSAAGAPAGRLLAGAAGEARHVDHSATLSALLLCCTCHASAEEILPCFVLWSPLHLPQRQVAVGVLEKTIACGWRRGPRRVYAV